MTANLLFYNMQLEPMMQPIHSEVITGLSQKLDLFFLPSFCLWFLDQTTIWVRNNQAVKNSPYTIQSPTGHSQALSSPCDSARADYLHQISPIYEPISIYPTPKRSTVFTPKSERSDNKGSHSHSHRRHHFSSPHPRHTATSNSPGRIHNAPS